MNYFLHKDFEISEKNKNRITLYFKNIKTITIPVVLEAKNYTAIIDVKSFLHLSNFDCFNCLTNCCVQFPYNFNKKARNVILNNLKEYDYLTKSISILKEEGLTESEIINSIKQDSMLIPDEHIDSTFDRCTCSCVHIDRHLCAIHKICIDKNYTLGEIIDIKPLWCSIYPLEIIQNDNILYFFVPTKQNNYLAMNDSNFACMDIEKSKSAYFRRNNPIGFKSEDYKPFIISYENVLEYIFGSNFISEIKFTLNLENTTNTILQYNKKI
ncbi:MAG: hypothetical protein ACRC5W_08335 [Cetobacterium sp.]|uniref:hypothetical protein n=1 Tax=Cetobacterium sp. TaxID=2071632 RepID=UPI003F35587B